MLEVEAIDAPDNADGLTIDAEPMDNPRVLPDQAQPVSKRDPATQFTILSGWLRGDMDHSRPWRSDARFWFAFRAGEQWSDDDKALLELQQRPVIVFNRVLTILKAVAGMEINGRHEIQFLPVGTEDTRVNEVLSGASMWMANSCDAEDEESEAFDDTCTCGMGWTESRMSYEDDPAGMYVEEQVDPLEMYWDRTAKKKNLHDSRRRARVRRMPFSDARDMFPGFTRLQIDAVWAQDALGEYPLKSQEEKWRRDDDTGLGPDYDDNCEVTIVQIQWIEREIYWLVADAATQSKVELSDAEYKRWSDRMKTLGMGVHAARLTRKVYKQAFLGAQGVMLKKAGPAPLGKFTWDCITGEADKSKRSWFGLVKLLRDPQIWANKWLSQILHILNTTAKGGIIAELDAFDDEREAEESYAQPEAITWAASGAISGGKIMAKPGTAMTEGYVGLLAFAVSSFKDVSGINLELLGQQDQNQPGVLEAMRKQAGMTVLATLFDSLRRYRKNVGRSRLYCIQNFMSDGRLVRVVAQGDGREIIQAVRLAKEQTTGKYDVIVDDAPTSPNQKEANWAIIQPMLVVFKEQLMANPAVLGMLLEYSPLPSRIVEAVKAFISQAQDDPAAKAKREEQEQIAKAAVMATIDKDVSTAELNRSKAAGAQSDAAYNMAVAQNLLADNEFEKLRQHIAMMEAQAKGEESQSKIALNLSKADRERIGAEVDVEAVRLKRAELAKNAQGESIGRLIESMTARAGAERDRAGAHLDYVKADKEARTPIERPAAAK